MSMKLLQPGGMFLFSIFDKNGEEAFAAACLAEQLRRKGIILLASGGTKTFLEKHGHQVTDVATLSGRGAVLGHRVVTLVPELHGGLLAGEEHLDELAELQWPLIDGVCCTFYDLEAAMANPKATYEDVNNAVDIGGPTMVSSAVKGGRIPIADQHGMEVLTRLLESDTAVTRNHIRFFQHAASRVVANYRRQEAEWRSAVLHSAILGMTSFEFPESRVWDPKEEEG